MASPPALIAGERRLLELLEMVARGCPLPEVLDALCSLVEDSAGDCRCSVLLVHPDSSHLQHGAAPSLSPRLVEAIHGRPMIPYWGPCAMAVHQRTQVIVADLTDDARWSGEWCGLALDLGLRSCWTTPILSLAGKALGTFAIYRHEPGSPTPLQQGLIEQFTHIASIAIERAQNETALKRSEAFLAEAQRLSSTGSFSWRLATDQIVWSEQTYRIYEIDPSEKPVTFELVGSRLHPEEIPWFQELVEGARRDGRDLEFEHRLRMPDGSIKHLHVVAHANRDQDGQVEYIGAVQDVTERRLAEEALGKVRSELAHVTRVATVGALMASIDGDHAAEVVGRLRALFTKQETAAEAVDLNEATREVLALSWSEVQRGRVTVRTNLAADLPLIHGDRVQLQQVVLNLLLNALEAMAGVEDRPRLLAIRTERDAGDRVRLSVQDSGAGFDPQNLERLFEAFYSTKAGGMGIGLSISRSIVEGHQGRLSAALNDGPGATFSFSIPRTPGRIAAVPGGSVPVFDDDVSLREALESLIRWAGWRPETFASAQEAAEMRALRERYASLTRREREVMALVVAGLLNKQIGAELGTSEVTVKAHRGKMMRKMQAGSLADLVRAAAKLNLPLPARPLETDTFVQ